MPGRCTGGPRPSATCTRRNSGRAHPPARRRVGTGPNGIADIAGIPRPVLRAFSTRRREIEAHLDEHGQPGARAAQVATYATRRAKNDVRRRRLVPEWRARAAAHGLDDEALAEVLDRLPPSAPPTVGSPQAERLYRWLASPDGLTGSVSTFGRREVIKAVCNALPSGGRVDQVLELVDGFLRSEHVLPVRVDDRAAVMYRRDGTVVAARTDGHRWTTPEMLETETRLLASALDWRATGTGVADDGALQDALLARPSLSQEQARMVQTIGSSGDGVEIVEGVAGAGKTFALAAAREAWNGSGYRVLGCSLAARAAKQLEDDAGIPASSVDRLLAGIDRHPTALDASTVLVVDEAAMVGTRKLASLLAHARTAGTKVVLVGDPCQLPEIEAGGTFAGLQDRLGASRLTDNRRQADAWERATLAELRAGNPDRALDAYVGHGRVHHAASETDARDQLVDAWMTAHVDGDDVLMVASRLADVDDLNRRARYVMWDEGDLGDDRVVLGGRPFAEHERVLALRNDYQLGLLNGTRAVVERIDTSRHEMTVTTTDQTRLVVPFAYAEAGHLTHGYATTIHKAQGATVDRCYVLGDDTLTREHAYTALSRGRHANHLNVVTDDPRVDERHANEITTDPLDTVRRAIGRRAAKTMAVDQIEPRVASLEQLRRERDSIRAHLGHGPADASPEYRDLTEAFTRETDYRDGAQWRLDNARISLDQLGPIGRRTHRASGANSNGALPASRPTSPATARSSRTSRRISRSSHPRSAHAPNGNGTTAPSSIASIASTDRSPTPAPRPGGQPGRRARPRPRPRNRTLNAEPTPCRNVTYRHIGDAPMAATTGSALWVIAPPVDHERRSRAGPIEAEGRG